MADPTSLDHAPSFRAGNVVVVLNASDRDHFTVSGEAPYRAACPAWARLTFLDDHEIAAGLVELLREGDVDAVVFASGALASEAAQRAVTDQRFVALWTEDGPARDTGALVLHQYLRPDARLSLDFLGSAAFTLVGEPARRVEASDIEFRDDWWFVDAVAAAERSGRFRGLATGYGREHHCVWARCEFTYPAEWERVAWERRGSALVAACAAGDRVVVSSRVPIDLTGEHELLGSLIAACLRPRGCLLVEAPDTTGLSAFSTSLASAIDRNRFVHRVRPATADEIDPGGTPYCFFDELIVAPEWPVTSIASLSEETVLRKLEEGGSIVATFSGPADRPVAVRLSGRPQYAERANRLAEWLLPRLAGFRGDVWNMRALAEAVAATRSAYVDDRLIPQALRADFVARQLRQALADRVDDDSVDEIVLATVATYTALSALGEPGTERMRKWVDEHLDREMPSVIAQALVLDPELETPERRRVVEKAVDGQGAPRDDARLLAAYAALLFAESDPDRISAAAADRSLGLGVQAQLLRAVARHRLPVTRAAVELAAHVRSRVDRLAAREGALEAVCLGNAALIELARRQGLAPNAEVRGRPREIDAQTVEQTNLAMDAEDARRDAARYRAIARLASSMVFMLLILLTIAPIVAIALWFDNTIDAKVGFAATVFGVLSGLDLFFLRKARAAGIPPWPFKPA